jgi:hypothetical protein
MTQRNGTNGAGLLKWTLGLAVGIALSLCGAAFGYTQARIGRLEDTSVTRQEIRPQLESIRDDIAEIKELLRERG